MRSQSVAIRHYFVVVPRFCVYDRLIKHLSSTGGERAESLLLSA